MSTKRFRVCAKQSDSNSKTRRHQFRVFLGKPLASSPMLECFSKWFRLKEQGRNFFLFQVEEKIIIEIKHGNHPLSPPTSYHRARRGTTANGKGVDTFER